VLVVVSSRSLLNLFFRYEEVRVLGLERFLAELEFVGCCMNYMIAMNM